MNFHILFGTESGNAEMAADDTAAALAGTVDATVTDLADTAPSDLLPGDAYLILCSTYGDGELPASAQPFHQSLAAARPCLSGVRYAMFFLGDSGYDTYCQGGRTLDALLTDLGALRVGDPGEHDASGPAAAGDAAAEWAVAVAARLTRAA